MIKQPTSLFLKDLDFSTQFDQVQLLNRLLVSLSILNGSVKVVSWYHRTLRFLHLTASHVHEVCTFNEIRCKLLKKAIEMTPLSISFKETTKIIITETFHRRAPLSREQLFCIERERVG